MRKFNQGAVLLISLVLVSMRAVASPTVDNMTDTEVSEYAVRMSNVLDKINDKHLCWDNDIRCVRSEFSRHGVSYDDKLPVQKRLVIMLGSIY